MLRHLGVRSKLLALVAVPMAFLFAITGVVVFGQYESARRASEVRSLADVATALNEVVHRLQVERSATLDWQVDPNSANLNKLRGQRALVDTRIATLHELAAKAHLQDFAPQVGTAIDKAAGGHNGLRAARTAVDRKQYGVRDTMQFYGGLIATDLELPSLLAQEARDAELGRQLQAYQALSTAIEQQSAERDLMTVALGRGILSLADFQTYAGLVAGQATSLQTFRQLATPQQNRALTKIMAAADPTDIGKYRAMAADLLAGRVTGDQVAAYLWVQAINTEILPLSQLETQVVGDVAGTAAAIELNQQRDALLLIGLLIVGLGLASLLTVVLARRITRPLRRLTTAVTGIGEELPRMVERMQIPGEGPGVEFEEIPVESRDEIGQLAEAFNSVNEVTVRVAKEQAALRASIAEMFVNVARRNQVLLGRQLTFIDQMESSEENPDVLENLFRLDHLATRMRRNAESLLVLAGIDATRRLRSPLPLSDVIRTAVSEIESYERVDLAVGTDPEVSGRFALTVAHLLAELLENATHFSNPETRVVVATSAQQSGVEVVITDYGLGMSDEELEAANDRIANPPVAEIAVAQRLGFYVVGRLAKRLGVTAQVQRGRTAGTVVTLRLPNSIFVGLAAPEDDLELEPAGQAAPETVPFVPVELDRSEPAEAAPDAIVEPVAVETEPAHAEPVAVETSADAEPVHADTDTEPALVETEPAEADAVEIEAVADEPEPAHAEPSETQPALAEPAAEAEPVEVAVQVEAVPVEAVAVEPAIPQPEPTPVPTFAYVPAVDILPGGAMPGRRGRRGRRAAAPPPVAPAAPAAAWPAPPAVPTQAPAPAASLVPATAPAEPTAATAAPTPGPVIASPTFGAVPQPSGPSVSGPPVSAPPVSVPPVSVPVPAPTGPRAGEAHDLPSRPTADMDRISADARLHAAALTELRGLYEPSFAPANGAGAERPNGLARRSPKAAEEAAPAPAQAPAPATPAPRTRTAAEVRGMLAGFRSGVERGRTAPTEPHADPQTEQH